MQFLGYFLETATCISKRLKISCVGILTVAILAIFAIAIAGSVGGGYTNTKVVSSESEIDENMPSEKNEKEHSNTVTGIGGGGYTNTKAVSSESEIDENMPSEKNEEIGKRIGKSSYIMDETTLLTWTGTKWVLLNKNISQYGITWKLN